MNLIAYEFQCDGCDERWEQHLPMAHRNKPEQHPCPSCNAFKVRRLMGCGGFNVPEGGCGNAANGYSSYHGDAENFKARSRGEPEPYPK